MKMIVVFRKPDLWLRCDSLSELKFEDYIGREKIQMSSQQSDF